MAFCPEKILLKSQGSDRERGDVFTDIFTSSLSSGDIPEDWSQELDNLQKA